MSTEALSFQFNLTALKRTGDKLIEILPNMIPNAEQLVVEAKKNGEEIALCLNLLPVLAGFITFRLAALNIPIQSVDEAHIPEPTPLPEKGPAVRLNISHAQA